MQNQISLKDGIIHLKWRGVQDSKKLAASVKESGELITYLVAEGKPVLVLADVSDLGMLDSEARKLAAKSFDNLHFDKVAIFGANKFYSIVIKFIITGARHQKDVRQFKSEPEAIAWLGESVRSE